MRIILGGLAGGVLLFLWGWVDHAVLPFGRMGFSEVPNQATFQKALQEVPIQKPGLYLFPWISEKATKDEQKSWAEKYKTGPSGLLILQPQGTDPATMKMMGIELGADILAALFASWVLTVVGAGYGARVTVVVMLGLFGWLAIEISNWNWYGFPTEYILGQLADQFGGCLLMGLVLAAIIRPPSFPGEDGMTI